MSETVTLKLTGAVAIAGTVHRAGTIVEVSDDMAKNFLHRGKAVLADEGKAPATPKTDSHQGEGSGLTTDQDARARVLTAEGLTVAEFEALSAPKRKALLKQAADQIAKETAAR